MAENNGGMGQIFDKAIFIIIIVIIAIINLIWR